MADQLPDITLSSSGGQEDLDSSLINHVDVNPIARDTKVKAKGPVEARLTTNVRNYPNKLVRNVSKDATTQRLDGRKDPQPRIDPLSQVRLGWDNHLCPMADSDL
ncbi:MAG: hypothetical protein Q9172_000334 [Xanthocarpia lactea]